MVRRERRRSLRGGFALRRGVRQTRGVVRRGRRRRRLERPQRVCGNPLEAGRIAGSSGSFWMTPTLLTEWSRLLIGTLARAGVEHVVLSPGSRSTPFAWAALNE